MLICNVFHMQSKKGFCICISRILLVSYVLENTVINKNLIYDNNKKHSRKTCKSSCYKFILDM
jgi:hypothetical protein